MKIFAKGAAVLLVITGAVFVCAAQIGGQDKIRTVVKPTTNAKDPIGLVGLEVGNRRFDSDHKTLANSDWLKNLSLSVKNTSDKGILHIAIHAIVPKQGTMAVPRRLTLRYGTSPKPSVFGQPDGSKLTKVLRPNEVVAIQVLNAENVARALLDQKADPEAIELIYDFIVFEDGTAWSPGQWLRANPSENRWDFLDRNGVVPVYGQDKLPREQKGNDK